MGRNAQVPSDQPHEGTPAGTFVRCDAAISRYSQKTCLFGRFFTSSQNTKWRHFRSYRRFTAMFEQAELRGTQMGPNGPPNAKETAQIAPEIAILENRAFW